MGSGNHSIHKLGKGTGGCSISITAGKQGTGFNEAVSQQQYHDGLCVCHTI